MKNIYLIFLFFLFPSINIISAQGFELFLGYEQGDNKSLQFTNIPDSDNYLAVWKTDSELHFSNLDANGNLLETVSHELTVPIHKVFESKITENGILVAYVISNNFSASFGINEFDFSGTLVNSVIQEYEATWAGLKGKFNDNNEFIVFGASYSKDKFIYAKMSIDEGIQEYKEIPESSLTLLNSIADILLLPDGDFIVLMKSSLGFEINALVRFDATGETIWETPVPIRFMFKKFMKLFPSGDKILLYGDNGDVPGFGTYFAVYSTSGEELWIEDFTNHFFIIEKFGVILGENNTIYAHGYKQTDQGPDLVLLNMAADGTILWEQSHNFFGTGKGQLLRDNDNGFFIATIGYPEVGFSSNPHIVKLDSVGNTVWSWHTIRDDYYLHNNALITAQGEYLICGASRAPDEDFQAYFLKADSVGMEIELPVSSMNDLTDISELISVFPQPAISEGVNFSLLRPELIGKNTRLEIVNLLGQVIRQEEFREETLQVRNLPIGTHFYSLVVDNQAIGVGKVLILK